LRKGSSHGKLSDPIKISLKGLKIRKTRWNLQSKKWYDERVITEKNSQEDGKALTTHLQE
jgi:hypothetical protein